MAATLAETLVALGVLHGAVGHAMRARGMTWRLRDSALVSPLLLVGLFVFFGSTNHAVLRYALDVERTGHAQLPHLVAMVGAAGGGLAIAWFGARAVGKLY